MILALAGRRIDDPNEKVVSFPMKNISSVRAKLKRLFVTLKPSVLVCSGSCGADLLALDVAGDLGITRCMVIPFPPELFKSRSVADRPGDWTKIFDRVSEQLNKEEKVIVMNYSVDDEEAYRKTNLDIISRAQRLSDSRGGNSEVRAVIVWESGSKGERDTSAHFKKEAEQRGLRVEEINTIDE